MSDPTDMECWDCRGQDLPCETCGGTRRVPCRPLTGTREREIMDDVNARLGPSFHGGPDDY